MSSRSHIRIVALAGAALIMTSLQASAHHPTGGMMPTNLVNGFLSGVGHPVLGVDHLAFVVGIGMLAAIGGFGLLLPALFVIAMAAGLGLHVLGATIPFAEYLLAASVLLIGLSVARSRTGNATWLEGGLFACAGLLHGYAFAETVIGAEPTPISAYVFGLALMQMTIAALAHQLVRGSPMLPTRLIPAAVRVCGLAIAVVGAAFLAYNASGLAA